jgi:uncharacterized protein (DUF1778 family)
MANLIKRIVKAQYETSDGKVFEDKGEASKHQTMLDRRSKIEALIKAQLEYISSDADGYADYIAQFILDNADALREILPKRAKSIVLNEQESEKLEAALETPPAPNEALHSAMAAFKTAQEPATV